MAALPFEAETQTAESESRVPTTPVRLSEDAEAQTSLGWDVLHIQQK